MKIYQVVIGNYFYMETQEICYGYYSTRQKAEERKQEIIKQENDAEDIYIYEIELDKDIKEIID